MSSAQPLARRQSQRLLLSSEKKTKTKNYYANTTNGRKQTPTKPKREKLDLTGDRLNICLLLLLYTLQGVPMGLSSTVAFSLTEKGASFGDQGVFSLASWPFSLKILWAPMIDALRRFCCFSCVVSRFSQRGEREKNTRGTQKGRRREHTD